MDSPHDHWESRIRSLCAEDAALAGEVRSLLGFHKQADNFLDARELMALTAEEGRAPLPPAEAMAPGTRLGEYTVRGLLGVGGMGSVYVAEQTRPRRTVALKVIARDFATPGLMRRFEREAELLGRLHHPGIAQIFEAGAAAIEGQSGVHPYIAMELINGPPLTAYATAAQLDTAGRLDLIARVCDAVQHAHQRGVIHRDLKPANILVDENGQPKVVDFGVARTTEANAALRTMRTGVGQLIGTLSYMSPEQVQGDPDEVDVRSDVYALGVVLYQVLTGRLPLDVSKRAIPDAVRAIREETPPRPGTIDRSLRGEVEIIVSKAIEKDRERRYQSAAALAADLRRHLQGEPIEARQDSAMYVLRKQAHRYRWPLSLAVAGVVAISAFAVYASIQAKEQSRLAAAERASKIEAREALARADQTAEDLRRLLYVSRVGHAHAAITLEDSERARVQLDQCPAELRGWEWTLLDRLCDQSVGRLDFPDRPVHASITQRGLRAAVAPSRGPISIIDTVTGQVVARHPRPYNRNGLAISADGTRLLDPIASGGLDILDTATGERVWSVGPVDGTAYPFASIIRTAAFVSNREILLVRRDATCEFWTQGAATPTATWKLSLPNFNAMRVSGDGSVAALGFDSRLCVINPRTGEVLATSDAFSGTVMAIAFTPDASRVGFGTFSGTAGVWDWRTAPRARTANFDRAAVAAVAIDPDDGLLLVAGRSRVLSAFDMNTMSTHWRQRGELLGFSDLLYLPVTGRVLTLGSGSGVRLWSTNPRPGLPVVAAAHSPVFSLEPTPDNRGFIVTERSGMVTFLDQPALHATSIRSGPEVENARGTFELADGRMVTFAPRELLFWRTVSDAPARHVAFSPEFNVLRACLSPDQSSLYAGTGAGHLLRVDLAAPDKPVVVHKGQAEITGVVAAPGRVACGDRAGVVRVFEADGRPGPEFNLSDAIQSMAFNTDGSRLAVGFATGKVLILDLPSGRRMSLTTTTRAQVYDLQFLSGGTRLAGASADQTVRMWLTATGEELLVLPSGVGPVGLLALSADGKTLAGAGSLGSVALWELDPPIPLGGTDENGRER